MSLARLDFSTGKHAYAIHTTLVAKNTYAIQVLQENNVLFQLHLDALDNTLAAYIDAQDLNALGEDKEIVLNYLSQYLQQNIGAKEFVFVPNDSALPEFQAIEAAPFKRTRQATAGSLKAASANILAAYPKATMHLNENLNAVMGIDKIIKHMPHQQPYAELFALLNQHANFTPGKMSEYSDEEMQGAVARFNNANVQTMALFDASEKLRGLIRFMKMGGEFLYLSDETMDQSICPADQFAGENLEAKQKERSKFLLAYLLNQFAQKVDEKVHLVMIAAANREDIYDANRLQSFPLADKNVVAMLKFGAPGPVLCAVKKDLLSVKSKQTSSLYLFSAPAQPSENIEPEALKNNHNFTL